MWHALFQRERLLVRDSTRLPAEVCLLEESITQVEHEPAGAEVP